MKGIKRLLVLLVAVLMLVGCSAQKSQKADTNSKTIDDLKVVFVPSRDTKDIAAQTEPIKKLLQSEMKKLGYDVKAVTITTSQSFEAAGEALAAGSAHVGLIPGGTYVAFHEKGVDVILASTRNGLKYDSANPKDWNTGEPNDNTKDIVTYYRGLVVAGPSDLGKTLAKKVNAGEKLVWDDIKDAKWCVQSTTSGSGYQYASLWLKENFDKTMADVEKAGNAIPTKGYGAAISQLQAKNCDIAPGFNDIRMAVPVTKGDQLSTADQWKKADGTNIWTETQVIGVTEKIQNDTVSVSTKVVNSDLAKALATAFIELAKTPEGAEAIKIYNHKGYQAVTDADYEGARKVYKLTVEANR